MGAPLAPRDPVVGRDGKISQNWMRYFDSLTNIFRSVFTFAGLVGQPTDNANLAAAFTAERAYTNSYAPEFSYRVVPFGKNPIIYNASYHLRDPSEIINVGGTYYVYFTKMPSSNSSLDLTNAEIGMASAPSIYGPWTELSSVLFQGGVGEWDQTFVAVPNIYHISGTYYLFYTGGNSSDPPGTGGSRRLTGVATSTSPTGPFTKSASNPVIPAGASTEFDALATVGVCLLRVDGEWRIYYKGQWNNPSNVKFRNYGMATCSDAEFPNTWHKYGGNPIFGNSVNGGTAESTEDPTVLVLNGKYYLMTNEDQSANEDNLWYVSNNGINGWQRTHKIEGKFAANMTGAVTEYENMSATSSILDGEFKYILASGKPDNTTNDGIVLYSVEKVGGDTPVTVDTVVNSPFDLSTSTASVNSNGTLYAAPFGTGADSIPYLNDSGFLGIGKTAAFAVDVAGEGSGHSIREVTHDATQFSTNVIGRTLGTQDLPTAVTSNIVLGRQSLQGGYDTTGTLRPGVNLTARATENWDSTHGGSKYVISTVANGTTTLVDNLVVDQDGTLIVPRVKFSGDSTTQSSAASPSVGSAGTVQISAGSGTFASDPAFNYTTGTLVLAKSASLVGSYRLQVKDDGGFDAATVDKNGDARFANVTISSAIDATSYKVAGVPVTFTGGTVTSITPGTGFTSSTPITTSGTLTINVGSTVAGQIPQLDSNARLGIGTTSAATVIHGKGAGIAITSERTTTATTTPVAAGQMLGNTSNTAADGFGSTLAFSYSDGTGISAQQLGQIGAVRAGASNTGDIVIRPLVSGTATERARVYSAGGGYVGKDTTDNTTFEADGTMTFKGAATVFNDLNISALMIATAGATVPTLTAINGSTVKAHGFTGTGVTVNEGWASLEILHDYKEGTDITPHVHWMPTTTGAGNIKWQMDYYWLNNGDVAGSPTTITLTASAGGTAWKEQRHSFSAITGTGKTIGSRFMFRIYRDPADAADTYGDAAILTDIGIHYEIDTVGSRQITSK